MASQVHDAAKAIRDALVIEREALVDAMKALTPNSPAWLKARDDVIRKSSEVREQGNIMRAEEGREMGEGTSYTGPLKQSTKDAIAALTAAENLVPLNPVTDWQQANINLFGNIDDSLSYGDQRTEWERLWDADRADMLEKQKTEYDRLQTVDEGNGNGNGNGGGNGGGNGNGDSLVTILGGGGAGGGGGGGGALGGAEGAMDLLAYRPWTQNYWTDYVPKASQGLLTAPKPQRDYGLAYLPGEHRDAAVWAAGAGGGGTGHIPAGAWRGSSKTYKTKTGANAPWRFTSGDPQASNIYENPWTARSMNLTKAQGKDWSGFLSDIDTSPVNKPGLLGVKFPKASTKKSTTKMVINN